MATNRELLSKLEDKIAVVKSLANEIDYDRCTQDDAEEVRGLMEEIEDISSIFSATADAMDNKLNEEERKEEDRSANEDDSDKE